MSHKALHYLHSQLSNIDEHLSDGGFRLFREEAWQYNWCDEDLGKRFPWWMHHHSLLDVAILTGKSLKKLPRRRDAREEPDDGLHRKTPLATIMGPNGKTAPISLRDTSAFTDDKLTTDLKPIAEKWFGAAGTLTENAEANLIRWMVRDPEGPIVSTALLAWPETALYMLNYLSLDEGDVFNGMLPSVKLKECFGLQVDGDWLYHGVAHDMVDEEIASLPSCERLTLSDEAHVMAARASYEALTAEQKGLVSNIAMLELAESRISSLAKEGDRVFSRFDDSLRLARKKNSGSKEDADYKDVAIPEKEIVEWVVRGLETEIADEVDEKISRIPTRSRITLADADSVASARESLEALTAAQKALTNRSAVLEGAEAKIAELRGKSRLEGFSMSRYVGYLWEDFGDNERFSEELYEYMYSLGELCHILIGLSRSAKTRTRLPRYDKAVHNLPKLPKTFEDSRKEQDRPNTSYAVLDIISALYIAAICGPKPLAKVLTAEINEYLNASTSPNGARELPAPKQPVVSERIRPLVLEECEYVDEGLREGVETEFNLVTQEISSYKESIGQRHFSKHWQPKTMNSSFFALPGQTVVAGRHPGGFCGARNAKLVPVPVKEAATKGSTLARVQFEIGVLSGEWCLFDRGTAQPYSDHGILVVRDGHALHIQQYADGDEPISFVGSEVWNTSDHARGEAFEFVDSGYSAVDGLELHHGVRLRVGDYIYLSPVLKHGTLMPDVSIHFFKVAAPKVPVGSWVSEATQLDG